MLSADPQKPAVAMAFKTVEDPYGALTFVRIYQGRIVKGAMCYNQRTGRKERFGRIVRMHADQRQDVEEAVAGDIVAVLGLDCASGDTYASEYPYCSLERMFVPEPVIKAAIEPLFATAATAWPRPCSDSAAKTRRCASPPTTRPARRSWPGWASCTWRCAWSGSAASSTSRSAWASPR